MPDRRLFFIVVAASIWASPLCAQSVLDGFVPNVNGSVYTVVVQPDGKILLGGAFTTVSPNGGESVSRNHIARLNPDGTLDATFNPGANDTVYSIALQADGRILVGGLFTSVSGLVRNRIARLDPSTGQADSFNPNASGDIYAIAVQSDGKVVAGGQFTNIGGQARSHIARIDPGTGLADSFDPNADANVYAIALQPNGKILIGGIFGSVGGQQRRGIARLDPASGLADVFNPDADDYVYSIALQADGKVLAGGLFHSVGGQVRPYLARLDPLNGQADSFTPNPNAGVFSIAVQQDGRILVGGAFGMAGGQTRHNLARLDAATSLADSFDPNANDQVRTIMVQADGKILAGGDFTSFAPNGAAVSSTRNKMARLEINGGLDRTFRVNLNTTGAWSGGRIIATAVQPDGKILIGGYFHSVMGLPREQVARLNSDGTLDPDFSTSVTNFFPYPFVNAIVVEPDGKILVGGSFSSVGGLTRNNIARIDPSTGAADSFTANTNGEVTSIFVQADGKILVAGNFSVIGTQSRKGIARLDGVTGATESFNAQSNSAVDSIAVQRDGKILVGGAFTSIGGQVRNYLARLDPATALADSFNPFANSRVGEIIVEPGDKILVAGDFHTIGGQVRNGAARLDPLTALADSFNPNVDNLVFSMALQANGKVFVGGSFFNVGGQARPSIARVDGITGLVDSFNPDVGYFCSSVALQGDGKVLIGGSFATVGGQRRFGLARSSNDAAALPNLQVSQNTVRWRVEGAGPQFYRVTFEYSDDNTSFVPLGNGEFMGSDWSLTGLSLPLEQSFYVRARGFYRGGYRTGSESIAESVRNAFLTSGPTPSPSPTPIGTPSPSPTPNPLPTPTPTSTPPATPTPGGGPACFLAEDFLNVTALPGAGWVEINHSTFPGPTGWFQGNGAVFPAQAGDAPFYVAANFQNGGTAGGIDNSPVSSGVTTRLATSLEPEATPSATPAPPAISNWLLTPPVTLQNGATLIFFTRTVDQPQFPDRLQVRMSTNGDSTNVGNGALGVGDFTTLMLDINEFLVPDGYPSVWTQFTVTVSGVPARTTGRLALRYFVPNGGPNGLNSDYIGVDSLQFNGVAPCVTPTPAPTPIPTPASISGSVTYCNNTTPQTSNGVLMSLTGSSGGSTSTAGAGAYTFSGLPSGGSYTVTPTKPARAPGSTGINTLDVVAIQRHFLGTALLTGCRLTSANVSPPAAIDTLDVIAVQHFFLGQTAAIGTTGTYVFNPVRLIYAPLGGNQSAQNFNETIMGDVAGPFITPPRPGSPSPDAPHDHTQ